MEQFEVGKEDEKLRGNKGGDSEALIWGLPEISKEDFEMLRFMDEHELELASSMKKMEGKIWNREEKRLAPKFAIFSATTWRSCEGRLTRRHML